MGQLFSLLLIGFVIAYFKWIAPLSLRTSPTAGPAPAWVRHCAAADAWERRTESAHGPG